MSYRDKTHQGATPARRLALEITHAARLRHAYVRELLDSARTESTLDKKEFDFAQVLCFGVVACMGTLDEAIDYWVNDPSRLDPRVRDALRIEAYELLFLHKPAHVIVDQGVELVRIVEPHAAGLANAVLHRLSEEAEEFPWGNPATSDLAFARTYGVPVWLAQALIDQYGQEDASKQLACGLEPAPTYLCANPFREGQKFASDLSAQFVATLVPLKKTVLEIGAGRGTKTALMEIRAKRTLGDTVLIDAVDLHEFKGKVLEKRMKSMGIAGVFSHTGDARDLSKVEGLLDAYDTVLVDAPCSGTGTLRRHPEIRWHLTPEDANSLADLQFDLVCEASKRVRQGGTLVYSTCSVLSGENEGVVEDFLASEQGRDFKIVPIKVPESEKVPGWHATERGFFASVPTSGGPDGHFAARLVRA